VHERQLRKVGINSINISIYNNNKTECRVEILYELMGLQTESHRQPMAGNLQLISVIEAINFVLLWKGDHLDTHACKNKHTHTHTRTHAHTYKHNLSLSDTNTNRCT